MLIVEQSLLQKALQSARTRGPHVSRRWQRMRPHRVYLWGNCVVSGKQRVRDAPCTPNQVTPEHRQLSVKLRNELSPRLSVSQ